jgi:hypothetical protein
MSVRNAPQLTVEVSKGNAMMMQDPVLGYVGTKPRVNDRKT